MRRLVPRLQLARRGIIDVGLLTPDAHVGFFEACDFGPDPEESTTMVLSAEGKERWRAGAASGWEWRPRPGLAALLLRAL